MRAIFTHDAMETTADKPLILVREAELCETSNAPFVVRMMAAELAEAVGYCAAALERAAMEREQSEPTFVGRGLAVPHARVSGLPGSAIYVARSTAGIPWAEGVAHVVLFTAAPEEYPEQYLKLLSAATRWRMSYASMEKLLQAPAEHLCERLRHLCGC